jgi:hypothetical protein
MARNGTTITAKQERTVLALLVRPTIQAAAEATGIGQRTLYRWLKEPAFKRAYREARREAVSQAVAQLQQAAAGAVTTLSAIVQDANAPAAVRVSAAKTVLELALKGQEQADLEHRLAALEEATSDEPPGRKVTAFRTPTGEILTYD